MALQPFADTIHPSQHVRVLQVAISTDVGLEKHVTNLLPPSWSTLTRQAHTEPGVCCDIGARLCDVSSSVLQPGPR